MDPHEAPLGPIQGQMAAMGAQAPPGVGMGMKPEPVYLQEGDVMEVAIQGLGSQRQEVGRDTA